MLTQNSAQTIYCFHYYLPMTHSADNKREHEHSHTLEITTFVRPRDEEGKKFEEIEKYAAEVLGHYENRYLNDMAEFGGDASIERIGNRLFEDIRDRLDFNHVDIERLEIGENPLRTYIVSTYM